MLMVVDSSVVAKWFFPEKLQQQALNLRSDWISNVVDLIAPDLILAEVSNIIWKKQRSGLITETEAKSAITDLLALAIPRIETHIILPKAYDLAQLFGRTIYDSLYIALAIEMEAKFVTADLRLCNAVSTSLEFVQYLGTY